MDNTLNLYIAVAQGQQPCLNFDLEKCPVLDLHSGEAIRIHHDANSASRQKPQSYVSMFILVIFSCDITGHTCPLRGTFEFCAFICSFLGDISVHTAD